MTFPNTQWSLLAIASMSGDPAGRSALEELCRLYRKPVLAYFRERLRSYEDAEDLTQRLLAQLTHTRIWQRADPEKGKFRDYLRMIALNALRNWQNYRRAARRGDGEIPESLDLLLEDDAAPPAMDGSEGRIFDWEWALAATTAALQSLEKDAGRKAVTASQFEVLKLFLPGGWSPPSYAEAAARLGVSPAGIGTLVHRLRKDFVLALRDTVRQTLGKGDDLDEEMAYLGRVLEEMSPYAPGDG